VGREGGGKRAVVQHVGEMGAGQPMAGTLAGAAAGMDRVACAACCRGPGRLRTCCRCRCWPFWNNPLGNPSATALDSRQCPLQTDAPPAPPTSILIVPLGPRFVFITSYRPLAAPVKRRAAAGRGSQRGRAGVAGGGGWPPCWGSGTANAPACGPRSAARGGNSSKEAPAWPIRAASQAAMQKQEAHLHPRPLPGLHPGPGPRPADSAA
jgi:hypothetical protein